MTYPSGTAFRVVTVLEVVGCVVVVMLANAFFSPGPSNLQNLQRPAYGEQKGKTERERLTQYVEEQEKKVELMTPHCHLEVALKE